MKNGKVSQAVLDRSVLRQLKKVGAAGPEEIFGADSAFINAADGRTMITTSSDVVKGLYDRTPAMVAAGCLNSLTCSGADASDAVISLMFPSDGDEKELADIIRETGDMFQKNGASVVNGHTAVSSAVTRPVLTVTVTGSKRQAEDGQNEKGKAAGANSKVKAGDAIVMTGYAGLGGTAILAAAGREALLKRFPHTLVSDAEAFAEDVLIKKDVLAAEALGGAAMHDVSEGGVFGALWEIAEREQIGFSVNLRSIPLRQETVEICEFYDLNPYQLYGAGGCIMIAPRGEEICSALNAQGRSAAVIGYVTDGKGREIVNGEETRYLEKPQQDMLRVIAEREENK